MDNYIHDIELQLHDEKNIYKKIDIMNNFSWQLRRNDRDKSINLCREAYELSESINYQNGLSESLLCLSYNDIHLGNYSEAIEKSYKALEILETLDNPLWKMKAINSLGFTYGLLGKNDKSLEFFLKGLKIADSANNQEMMVIFLNNIGELYKNCMGMYDDALGYFIEALKISTRDADTSNGFLLNSIGDTYLKLKDPQKALKYCNMGLNNSKKNNDRLTEAQCYKNLARIYKEMNDTDGTIENCNKSLLLYQRINNKQGEAEVLTELGSLYINNRIYENALNCLKKALVIAKEINTNSVLMSIHHYLADTYEKTNHFKDALLHYKQYIRINNEIITIELEKKMSALSIDSKLEQAEKDAEIYKLKNIELKEKSIEIESKAKELEESYKNIAILSEIGQKITSSLDIETIMNTIYENMNSLMDATIFGVGLYDEETNIIDYRMFIENSHRIPQFITILDPVKSIASQCIVEKKEIVLLDLVPQDKSNYIPDDSSEFEDSPPRSLIYCPLIIENKVIGTITVQSYYPNSYSRNNIETLKTLASYIAIAVNNYKKTEELKTTARELENTLKNLKDAQEYLINSEKMAALGQLISGIAHEINTPLGAIQASIRNMSEYVDYTIGKNIPKLFKILNSREQDLFFNMLEASMTKDVTISSREERKYKKHLKEQLYSYNIQSYDTIADTFVDMGIYDNFDGYIELIKHSENHFIIQTCYEISGILRNIKNMDLAVGKASKILYALKSYSHYNHTDTPVIVDITEGINTILELYHNNIKHGTELIRKFGELPKVKCLPDELNQVWTNLIHNALQAMSYKGTLEIETYSEDRYVVIKFTDSGKGIPNNILNKIFDPFFTTKPPGEGSGLGLGIVKKIIDKHNGTITVESKPGKTTFTVTLPINMEN